MFEWLTLSNIGNVASILGIGLSLYVIYNVREIRKSYLFTARAPALLKSLRTHSSNIKDLLKEFETSIEEIETELARCSPIAAVVVVRRARAASRGRDREQHGEPRGEQHGTTERRETRKVGRHERRSISIVIKQITTNKSLSTESKNTVWNIYKELLKVEEELRNLHKDRQWER